MVVNLPKLRTDTLRGHGVGNLDSGRIRVGKEILYARNPYIHAILGELRVREADVAANFQIATHIDPIAFGIQTLQCASERELRVFVLA